MAIHDKCVKCEQELNEPGALLFGIPAFAQECSKWHICVKCYKSNAMQRAIFIKEG